MGHWSCAQYIDHFAAFSYGIELLRTPLTAYCSFICTPFIMAYIIDRSLATFYYQYNFNGDYTLLCLWVPDIYYHMTENKKGTFYIISSFSFVFCVHDIC